MTVRDLLDKASEKIELQSGIQQSPELESEIRTVLGQVYLKLGFMRKPSST